MRESGLADVEVTFVGDWHLSPGFIAANVRHIVQAVQALPEGVRDHAELVFTAHSIPLAMAQRYPYEQQIRDSADAVRAGVNLARGTTHAAQVVYQSRSGRPEDPWLEPDINQYLETAAAAGAKAIVICPIGFICDHVEVLYDLDVEAAATARRLNLPLARAAAVNDHPAFIEALTDSVCLVLYRYSRGRPLPLTAHGGVRS